MKLHCKTGKKLFPSKVDAEFFASRLKLIKHKRPGLVTASRAYLCQFCGNWHLTKQPKRGKS